MATLTEILEGDTRLTPLQLLLLKLIATEGRGKNFEYGPHDDLFMRIVRDMDKPLPEAVDDAQLAGACYKLRDMGYLAFTPKKARGKSLIVKLAATAFFLKKIRTADTEPARTASGALIVSMDDGNGRGAVRFV